MSAKTESEIEFERYLDGRGLPWTRLPEGSLPQPDYAVECGGTRCFFEVKEFDDPAEKPTDVGFSPCPAIKEKIHRARKKFRQYQNYPCAIVLWNSKILRWVGVESVLSAAFGQFTYGGIRDDLGAEPRSYKFFGGEAALGPSSNTTIGAIVILRAYELNHLWLDVWRELDRKKRRGEEIQPSDQSDLLQQISAEQPERRSYKGTVRTIVVNNPYARIPFPSEDLFSGPFDQRWSENSAGRFAVDFIGSELSRLRQEEGVPFVFL